MIYQGTARYPVHEAILHTSATPGDWWKGKTGEDVLKAFWQWHVKDNGWRKVGYHRVVMPDGEVLHDQRYLRSIWNIGAHVRERNRGTIGICMVPVHTIERMGRFEDFYTSAQRDAVRSYLDDLGDLTDLKWITGHNDYANKLCPGFKVDVVDWL